MITLVSSNFVFGVLKLCNSSFLFKIGFTQLLDTCLKFDVEVSISCVYPAVPSLRFVTGKAAEKMLSMDYPSTKRGIFLAFFKKITEYFNQN